VGGWLPGSALAGAESRGFNNNGDGARSDLREDEMEITPAEAQKGGKARRKRNWLFLLNILAFLVVFT
jgi:hypothetical protein